MFLALVALAVTMVERIPQMGAEQPARVRNDDELVLQFGTVPERTAPALALTEEVIEQPAAETEAAGTTDEWYVVQRGDTLSSIALDRLGSVGLAAELAALNDLEDPDDLQPGDRIRLR